MKLISDSIINQDYDIIADQLAEQDYCLVENFLSVKQVGNLRDAFAKHRKEDHFKKAGIGNMHLYQVAKEVRGDYIKWIEPENAHPAAAEFLELTAELMQNLNRLLYLSLKDFECHYAIYPPGTYYERHLDQFKLANNRKISLACYLNPDWKAGDGGELRIYDKNGDSIDIAPKAGHLAIFRSDTVEHEVLTTHTDRYSITGWMRDRPLDFPLL